MRKKIRCTLLNINAKQRNAKIIIIKKKQIIFLVQSYFGFVAVSFIQHIIQIRLFEWIHMSVL